MSFLYSFSPRTTTLVLLKKPLENPAEEDQRQKTQKDVVTPAPTGPERNRLNVRSSLKLKERVPHQSDGTLIFYTHSTYVNLSTVQVLPAAIG